MRDHMGGKARRIRLANGFVRLYIQKMKFVKWWESETIDCRSTPRFQSFRADTIVFASGQLIVDIEKGFWRRHAGMDNFACDKFVTTLNRWNEAQKYGLEMLYHMELKMERAGWNPKELRSC